MTKLIAAIYSAFLCANSCSHAFVVSPHGGIFLRKIPHRGQSPLYAERPDATPYIQAAIEASEKFGSTSDEARLAWETVEEIDSRDNSPAYSAKSMSEEECLIEDSEECISYHKKLAELYTTVHNDWLKEEEEDKMNKARDLVKEIQAVKMTEPKYAAGADSPALRQAVAAAKKAAKEFGADSTEAKLAWETVEEIGAARNYENAMGGALSHDECLVEKIEACEGLEEVKRVLSP